METQEASMSKSFQVLMLLYEEGSTPKGVLDTKKEQGTKVMVGGGRLKEVSEICSKRLLNALKKAKF